MSNNFVVSEIIVNIASEFKQQNICDEKNDYYADIYFCNIQLLHRADKYEGLFPVNARLFVRISDSFRTNGNADEI